MLCKDKIFNNKRTYNSFVESSVTLWTLNKGIKDKISATHIMYRMLHEDTIIYHVGNKTMKKMVQVIQTNDFERDRLPFKIWYGNLLTERKRKTKNKLEKRNKGSNAVKGVFQDQTE